MSTRPAATATLDQMGVLEVVADGRMYFSDLLLDEAGTEAADERLSRAGWTRTGDWEPDGAGWRAPVERI